MSTPVIKQLLNRRSIRAFNGEPVKEADLNAILQAAQRAPTSVNGQQISLVVTRDKQTIKKIAECAGGQPQVACAEVFITLVIDFNRTDEACRQAGVKQIIEQSVESITVGSIDAGIMLMALQMAAESLGYGTTVIGGIRKNPQAMIDLLKLPAKTFPVLGTTIGVPDPANKPQVKPRVPLESFAMQEHYDQKKVLEGVSAYDKTLRAWWDAQNMTEMPSYVQSTASYYSQFYAPNVPLTLKKQGFAWDENSK